MYDRNILKLSQSSCHFIFYENLKEKDIYIYIYIEQCKNSKNICTHTDSHSHMHVCIIFEKNFCSFSDGMKMNKFASISNREKN